jgi:hypothetical protein
MKKLKAIWFLLIQGTMFSPTPNFDKFHHYVDKKRCDGKDGIALIMDINKSTKQVTITDDEEDATILVIDAQVLVNEANKILKHLWTRVNFCHTTGTVADNLNRANNPLAMLADLMGGGNQKSLLDLLMG